MSNSFANPRSMSDYRFQTHTGDDTKLNFQGSAQEARAILTSIETKLFSNKKMAFTPGRFILVNNNGVYQFETRSWFRSLFTAQSTRQRTAHALNLLLETAHSDSEDGVKEFKTYLNGRMDGKSHLHTKDIHDHLSKLSKKNLGDAVFINPERKKNTPPNGGSQTPFMKDFAQKKKDEALKEVETFTNLNAKALKPTKSSKLSTGQSYDGLGDTSDMGLDRTESESSDDQPWYDSES